MRQRKARKTNGLIDVKAGMDALDVLEERLDRLLDRLNDLWDRAVGLEGAAKPEDPAS